MEVIFDPSVVCDNQTGWGPTAEACLVTTQPFLPYNKGDRSLGRIAEFGSSVHKYGRQQYNRGTYSWQLASMAVDSSGYIWHWALAVGGGGIVR